MDPEVFCQLYEKDSPNFWGNVTIVRKKFPTRPDFVLISFLMLFRANSSKDPQKWGARVLVTEMGRGVSTIWTASRHIQKIQEHILEAAHNTLEPLALHSHYASK